MAFTFDYTYDLPAINAKNYPPAPAGDNFLINVNYSIKSANPEDQVPTTALFPGQTLRIRVLAPPGVVSATIRAESNQWQGGGNYDTSSMPIMRTFSDDPGDYVGGTRPEGTQSPDGKIYDTDLKLAGGGLNDLLYGTGSPDYPMITTPRYLYFVLHNPPSSVTFYFASLNFSLLITDIPKYTAWRNERPWAGGSSSSIDGVNTTSTSRANTIGMPELGTTAIGATGTSTKIYGGISVQSGAFLQQTTQTLAEEVNVTGFFEVGAEHIGQTADLVVYATYTPVGGGTDLFYMLNNGQVIAWDQNIASLTPHQSNITLTADYRTTLYSGKFVGAGRLQVFFGYRLHSNNLLVRNTQPIDITINP